MGELFLHDLQPYVDKYGCNVFVETGTGRGTGLEYAAKYSFKTLFSIEIVEELCFLCALKFKDDTRIKIINGDSIIGLMEAVGDTQISFDKAVCFFWLDAHFPGADFQLGSYDDQHPDEIKYPLLAELKTIFRLRPDNKDVFIMDDLQLYEEGDYEIKMAPDFLAKHRRDIKPILEIFSKTHNLRRDYRHQGFLIAEPK